MLKQSQNTSAKEKNESIEFTEKMQTIYLEKIPHCNHSSCL